MSLLVLFNGPLNIPAPPPPPPVTGWGAQGTVDQFSLHGMLATNALEQNIEIDGNMGKTMIDSDGLLDIVKISGRVEIQ